MRFPLPAIQSVPLLLGLALATAAPQAPQPQAQARRAQTAVRLPPPERLYSRRALRRARLLIEMRMLEFRNRRLECLREVILSRLPPELRPESPASARFCPQGR